MITAYKHSQTDKVIESELDHTASWVNVVDPNWEEIEMLIDRYDVPEDFIRDPLDREESARVEYDEDSHYSLIILDLPIINDTIFFHCT